MDDKKAFEGLAKLMREVRLLSSCSQLLEWDQETYMPSEGGNLRAEQNQLISALVHKKKTSPALAKKIDALIDIESGEMKAKGLTFEEVSAVKNVRRDRERF